MALNLKDIFNTENIVSVLTIGLIVVEAISYVLYTWFKVTPIYVGPAMLIVIFAGIVFLVMGLIKRGYDLIPLNKEAIALSIVVAVLMVAMLIFLPQIAPELFKPSLQRAASAWRLG